jgi:hypothetical protein
VKKRFAFALCVTAVIAVMASCAKPYAPPGGPQDRTPPRLVATLPAALAVVPQFNEDIVFTFNETLAERGVNDASVSVSPQPHGKVHVRRKGNRVVISADGGWERNQLYRVILQPGIADRFNNTRKDPVELVFSTGPPVQNTAIAGVITDRITGRFLLDGAVEAVRRGDSATYFAGTDSAGFFALRYVPAGVYDMRAFSDGNHNRKRDVTESASALRQVALGATDTMPEEFVVLPADTSAPQLRRADATDSLHITLSFDDYIDPDNGLTNQTVFISHADGSAMPGSPIRSVQLKTILAKVEQAQRALQPPKPDTTNTSRDSTRALPPNRRPVTRADSMRADSLKLDSLRDAAQSARNAAGVGVDRNSNRRGGLANDTASLPDRDVVAVLTAPLPVGKYRVTVGGIRNVNGLVGGGSVDLDIKPAPPKVPPKTKAAGDTSHVAPKVPGDTSHAVPKTPGDTSHIVRRR